MTTVRVEVKLPWNDVVQGPLSSNTYYASVSDVTEAKAIAIAEAYADAYIAIGAGGWWSSRLTGDLFWSVYDLEDALPREAIATGGTTFAVEADTLPTEVALRVKMRSDVVTGVPRARHQGSVSLGPFAIAANGTDGRAVPGLLDDVKTAFNQIGVDLFTGIASAAMVAGSEQYGFEPVTNGRIVNEFTTVRRRQSSATEFVIWP